MQGKGTNLKMVSFVKQETGRLLESEDIIRRWTEHFETVYTPKKTKFYQDVTPLN